jgi:hypothetical protein
VPAHGFLYIFTGSAGQRKPSPLCAHAGGCCRQGLLKGIRTHALGTSAASYTAAADCVLVCI